MRVLLSSLALLVLAGCATDAPDPDRCADIPDRPSREACRGDTIRDERARADERGVGPPSCHPASTNPDLDSDRC